MQPRHDLSGLCTALWFLENIALVERRGDRTTTRLVCTEEPSGLCTEIVNAGIIYLIAFAVSSRLAQSA
jgi:hypothetical protein